MLTVREEFGHSTLTHLLILCRYIYSNQVSSPHHLTHLPPHLFSLLQAQPGPAGTTYSGCHHDSGDWEYRNQRCCGLVPHTHTQELHRKIISKSLSSGRFRHPLTSIPSPSLTGRGDPLSRSEEDWYPASWSCNNHYYLLFEF